MVALLMFGITNLLGLFVFYYVFVWGKIVILFVSSEGPIKALSSKNWNFLSII